MAAIGMTPSPIGDNLAPILLVEDNQADIRLTKEALSAVGVPNPTIVVTDGELALAYLQREAPYQDAERPVLVLMDLNLPRVDGRQVLEAIKSDLELRSIPVIILSTSAAPRDVEAAYHHHANCYLVKPLLFSDLTTLVRSIAQFWLGLVTLPPASVDG